MPKTEPVSDPAPAVPSTDPTLTVNREATSVDRTLPRNDPDPEEGGQELSPEAALAKETSVSMPHSPPAEVSEEEDAIQAKRDRTPMEPEAAAPAPEPEPAPAEKAAPAKKAAKHA